jgi:hypothetical protein
LIPRMVSGLLDFLHLPLHCVAPSAQFLKLLLVRILHPNQRLFRLRGGSPAANLAGVYELLQRGSHSSVSGQGCSNPSSDPAVRWDHICSETR